MLYNYVTNDGTSKIAVFLDRPGFACRLGARQHKPRHERRHTPGTVLVTILQHHCKQCITSETITRHKRDMHNGIIDCGTAQPYTTIP